MSVEVARFVRDWYTYSLVQMASALLTAWLPSRSLLKISLASLKPAAIPQASKKEVTFVVSAKLQPVTLSLYESNLCDLIPAPSDSSQFRRKFVKKMITDFLEKQYSCSHYKAHHFINARGERVFTQSWTPTNEHEMKALVILLHGLNEHSGRYENFAQALNRQGYGVYCMDWIGHGCSDGLHGYVERLDYIVADTRAYVKMVTADFPSLPCFLFGHSTGGSIALKAAMETGGSFSLGGVVLTSPALQIEVPNRAMTVFAPIASALFPTFQVPASDKAHAKVSRDPLALEAKYGDPLVYTGSVRVRTGVEILNLAADLERNLHTVSVPFLVLHGTDDQVTEPDGSRLLYDRAVSKHKKILLYEGLLHDLLFEPEKEIITEDIIQWLDSRMASLGQTW